VCRHIAELRLSGLSRFKLPVRASSHAVLGLWPISGVYVAGACSRQIHPISKDVGAPFGSLLQGGEEAAALLSQLDATEGGEIEMNWNIKVFDRLDCGSASNSSSCFSYFKLSRFRLSCYL
jgi:hypothetical protein